MPRRIQLSRQKGWRKPEGTISVARPTRWGNPFPIGGETTKVSENGTERVDIPDRETAVGLFRSMMFDGGVRFPTADDYPRDEIESLRGHDLACWCPLGGPCHADVLLELANASR